MSLRLRLLFWDTLGLAFIYAASTLLATPAGLGTNYVWKAEGVFTIAMTIAAGGIQAHHPFSRLGPANVVTVLRACLLSLVAAAIGEPAVPSVAWLGVIGAAAVAVLDGVDGWLARRSGLSSAFGARFDMEIDALLILVLSMMVWRHGKAGPWVLASGLMRYAFAAAGWVLAWMRRPLRPTFRGKTVAVINMVGLDVALGPIVPYPLSALAAGTTLAALAWSFALDMRRLWRNEG